MRKKRRTRKKTAPVFLIALLLLGVAFGIVTVVKLFRKPVDPHEGMVYVYDGQDWVWMTPLEGVPVSTFKDSDFAMVNGVPTYSGLDYTTMVGVDVSEHQYDIDWQAVASAGVDFAYIRVARRGYTEGGLFEDSYFRQNIEQARANGLKVGVYIFSQSINVGEAIEEANYVLNLIAPYPMDLPIVYDWEKIDNGDAARTDDLDPAILTDCAVAFCETVKNAGYEACVYFNRNIGYYGFDLSRLTDFKFWFALPDFSYPSFYYAMDMWQYSFSAEIPGISTPTDMNLIFTPTGISPSPEPEK